MKMRWRAGAALALAVFALLAHAASASEPTRPVDRADIVAAMRAEQRKGYALDAIANAVRLQAGVLLELAEQASVRDAPPQVLRIGHEDYRAAFIEVTGLTPAALPAFISVPYANHEDVLVEYRLDHIIDVAATPPAALPRRALSVKAGWPNAPDAPASYSFEDHSTDPALEATHERVTAFIVLDYGTLLVYDDIRGISGRATSGLLGAVFSLIGKARAVQTRFAIAPDGTQVSRTTAHKGVNVSQTVTITPDGKVFKGVPDGRSDLDGIDRALRDQAVNPVCLPLDMSPMPPAP
jgi:hypothetical protein